MAGRSSFYLRAAADLSRKNAGSLGKNAEAACLFLDASSCALQIYSNVEEREEQFVKAVLDPVQPQHLPHGQDLLKEALGHTATLIAPPPGDPLEIITARMERTAGTFARRARIGLILITLTALAAAMIGVISPWAIRDAVDGTNAIRPPGTHHYLFGRGLVSNPVFGQSNEQLAEERLSERAPPGNLAILFGDADSSGGVDPWKALWLSHPDDATLYSRYALAYLRANSTLPDGFVATGERLDPGNGWYRFLQSAASWKGRATGKTAVDPEAFKRLKEAMDMPRFDSHRGDFLARQIRALPAPRTYAEITQQQAFLRKSAEQLYSHTSPMLVQLPANFTATGRSTGDIAAIEQVGKKCARKLAEEIRYGPYQDQLVRGPILGWGSNGRADIVPGPHVSKEEQARALRFQKAQAQLPATPIPHTPGGFSQPISVARPDLLPTGAQMQPVFHSSRATLERLTLRQGLFLCLLALVACGLNHLQWRKTTSPLARRMTDLLTTGDRVWIVLIGCLLPLVLYLVAVRAPTYGIFYREIGGDQLRSYQMVAFAMAITSILLSLGMVRWRLAKRGAAIGFRTPGFRPGGFFVVVALIGFGAAWVDPSWQRHVSLTDVRIITWLLLWIALSWPFILFAGTLRSGPERRLHRTTISRALWGPLTLTCAIFTTLILLSYAEDRYWTARNTEETPRPEWAGNLTATKQRAADDLHRRLLELLDSK